MAVFRELHVKTIPSAILEFPNELFIEGQSHNVSTLTPLMNRTLSNNTNSSYNAVVTMSNKMWFFQQTLNEIRGSLQLRDFSTLDGGKSKMNFTYPMVYQSDRVAVSPMGNQGTDAWQQPTGFPYRSPSGNSVIFYDTTTLNPTGSIYPGIDLDSNPAASVFYGETLNYLYLMYVPNTGGISNSWPSYRSIRLDPDALSAQTMVDYGVYGGPPAWQNLTLVDESSDYFYFMGVYPNANISGSANTAYVLSYQNKATGAWASYPTANAPESANGPICWASSAINTGATTRAVFVPEFASTSGSQWNFAVTTYDTADITINPTTTTVSPTGAAGMPGSVYPGAFPNNGGWRFSVFRCWTFTSGATTYICVGSMFNGWGYTDYLPPPSNFYIHVYKCPTNNPSNIQYVSSTYIGGPGRSGTILPMDDNFSNVAIPYQNSVQFAYWNAGTETYVLGEELSKSPLTMGVDQTGRLWVTARDGSLNVFSPTVSGTVTVTFQDPSVVYNGSVINTNILVNSYNFAGNRIVSPVTLQIDSNSCTFADGSLTKTVNTLTSGDLLVPIKINASGYIRIVANISI